MASCSLVPYDIFPFFPSFPKPLENLMYLKQFFFIIKLSEKFLQSDWQGAVLFQHHFEIPSDHGNIC